jgi:transposase-like protein
MLKRRTFKPEFKARVALQALTAAKTTAQVCHEHQLGEQLPDPKIKTKKRPV